ncbi:transcriptional regulator family: C2H2 zinc finger [Paecilomyces variotii]|nr:transcriptional regulator family: C2H2 zinc finger [Paecilomyces variotii]
MATLTTQVLGQADGAYSNVPYTCNTCLVAFRSSDAQRDHMRRDWHLYNMKRRVASLPPVPQEVFTEKVLTAKATSSAAAARASYEKTCAACQKTFYSENSYQNHVKSSKHKLRESRMKNKDADETASVMSSAFSLGEPINRTTSAEKSSDADTDVDKLASGLKTTTIDEEDEQEDEQDAEADKGFSVSRCLFCPIECSNLIANADHMLKAHGMFVPEKDYLVDPEGLMRYLYRKITEDNECLYCHAIRSTAAGVRTHMRDKGHCMIAFETEEEQIEIGQFYDFTSTYSDDEGESSGTEGPAMGGVKLNGSNAAEDGWETESSASSLDDADGAPQEKSSRAQPLAIYESDFELHLPSGRSVGHRSLAKYYRQNLHSYPSAEERTARQLAIENGSAEEPEETERGRNRNRAVISRANGGMGMIGATDTQKREALTEERRQRTRALRQELRYTAKVNKAANSQKHFRDPLLQ